jgi:dTDP-4-dehydrorhamnose 3,5-epimerase/CDP-3, 6-dideoxy-D-glycero-D-glycero-4-hexulose-5-epimerase
LSQPLTPALLPAGAHWLPLRTSTDLRGRFAKLPTEEDLAANGITFHIRDEFCSISHRGVIRGMHFQTPPHEHRKMVCCLAGAVLDVLLDLRPGPGYGRSYAIPLGASNPALLLIPAGVAHGFASLEDASLMLYRTSTPHAPDHDLGVRYDSFGFEWPSADPILSERDAAHPRIADFVSPFAPCDCS